MELLRLFTTLPKIWILQPKEKGDIALSEDDFTNIPEYLNEIDYVLDTSTYNGKVEIHLAKQTDDGYVKILTVSSNERNSLQVTKLIGLSKSKFETKYAKKIERITGSLRGQNKNASNPSTTAQLTAGVLSNISIPNSTNIVKENSPLSEVSAENAETDMAQSLINDALGIENLSEGQKTLRKIGKAFGVEIGFKNLDEWRTDDNGKRYLFSPDGEYDPNTGKITLNTSKRVKHSPVAYILKHELTHSLEKNGVLYNDFADAVMESTAFKNYIKEKGFNTAAEYNADIVRQYTKKGVKNFDEGKADLEMVANFVGDMLFGGKTEITSTLIEGMEPKPKRSFIQWIKDALSYFKQKLTGQKVYVDEITQLEEKFLETVRSAQTKENTAQQDGGEKQNSISGGNITVNMTEIERAEILRNKQITPIKVTSDIYNGNFDFDDLENNIKSKVEKPLLKKFKELGLLKKYSSVAISDVDFDFTTKSVRKSLHSQETKYGGSKADFAKVVIHLQELLDNSVLIETHTDKGKGTIKENQRLKQVYVLLSAMQEGNTVIPVQFEVKQYVDDNNRLYLAVALTKIETGVVGNTASDKQMRTILIPISNISIPELFKKINPKDKNFLKYIPDEFLNKKQEEAKRQALLEDEEKYSRQYSLPQTTDADSLLEQYESGEITREEYLEQLKGERTLNPVEIGRMTKEDAIVLLENFIKHKKTETGVVGNTASDKQMATILIPISNRTIISYP